jgi:hypothetical protein
MVSRHRFTELLYGPLWFGPRSKRLGMYLRTVRGDTRRPNFSSYALAIRSSPHMAFSQAMRRMRA